MKKKILGILAMLPAVGFIVISFIMWATTYDSAFRITVVIFVLTALLVWGIWGLLDDLNEK